MSPLLLLVAAYALSKRGSSPYVPPSRGAVPPVVPPGTPVTGMKPGQKYTVTVLFTHPNEPPPAQLATDLNQSLASLAFNVDPSATKILQNADGTWSGQATGLYNGGDVPLGGGGRWTLLQLAAA